MNKLQNVLLEQLKVFHKLCEEQDLVYYALGGTALGAIRHNGFIPWDDDVDVGMPRADYEKLKSIAEDFNKNGRYIIEFPLSNKDYLYKFAKMYDSKTTLIENTRYKIKRGIYIDIFPIDGIGDSLEEGLGNFKKIKKWLNFINTRACGIRKERSFYKNLAILASRCIPECLCNTQKLIKRLDNICKRKKYDDCQYVANIYGNWLEKEIMQRAWVGDRKLIKFEDTRIFCVEDFHSYLTRLYGDYMQLPPEDKRISHHDYLLIDLQKSYLNE